MKNKNIALIIRIYTVILISAFFPISVSALADSGEETFSFRFENCTVTDALIEISQKSGINIISNSIIKKEIVSKSYTDKRLDKIISDLLRGENCAVVWNYSNGSLDSIGLYTYNEEDSKRTTGSNRVSRSVSNSSRVSSSPRTAAVNRSNRFINELNNAGNNTDNAIIQSNKRSNNSLPNNSASDNKNISKRVSTRRNTVSDTSRYSGNKRQTVSSSTDSSSGDKEEETVEDETSSEVTEPDTDKYNGLEPPPMPPGM
jgi:hypothetical protein